MRRLSLSAVLLLSLLVRPAAAQVPDLTLWGDFSGDGTADRLDIFQSPGNWKVSVSGTGPSTVWLAGWGPGLRNIVGDYDGDGRADVLIYVPAQGWHLLTSTGSAFAYHLNTNAGFGPGTRECAANYDYDAAAELIQEGFGNSTCWQWNAAGHFDWKTCSRVCNAPRPFVFTEGNTIYKDTGSAFTPYFVKGVSYMGCRNVPQYATPLDGLGREWATWALFFYRDCPETLVFPDFQDLRTNLGVNTVRILTPARKTEYGNPWEDWYNADGTISATAKAKLGKVFDSARALDLKLFLVLQLHYAGWGDVPVGGHEEAFWLNYMTSVGAWLKNEPALFGYEVAAEGMIRCPKDGPLCNYWSHENDPWAAHTLSFYTRMMRALRAADGNHLITSGQVSTLDRCPYNKAWHYPSPEFAVLPDVHNLAGGQPFSLLSQIDFLAPHIYAWDPPFIPVKTDEVIGTMQDIKAHLDQQPHPKPYVPAEINFAHDPLDLAGQPGAPSPGELDQAHFFDLVTAELNRAQANGMIVWDAFPQLRTIPGSYAKTLDNEYSLVTFQLFSPPHPAPRKVVILGADMWNLFYWDLADRPAAPIVRSYFAAH
jgi:hypothetical protein